MSTFVHAHAPGFAARDRQIVLAVLVSLVLHTSLMLTPARWLARGVREAASPVLEVQLEPDSALASTDTTWLDEAASPRDPSEKAREDTAPGPLSRDPPIDSVEDRELHLRTRHEAGNPAVSSAFAGPLDLKLEEETRVEPPASLTPVEIQIEVDPAAASDTIVATIAPAERSALTHRVLEEAEKLLESGYLEQHIVFNEDGGEFAAVLRREPAAGLMDVERLSVEITTEREGERIRTSLQLKRLAFSHFTQLIDYWQPSVQLHDDEVVGRFHSNSEIYLTYDRRTAPRLLGKVTARGIRVDDEKGWRPRGEIFAGGLQTRAKRIGLPRRIDLPVTGTSDADVLVLSSDANVVFAADGSYECIELGSQRREHRRLMPDKPTFIVGLPGTELRVRGAVNGKVTLYSPERIVVQGDLKYARNPRTGTVADAYLGLVSDGSIEIDRAEVTGPGDLEIDAAIYARQRFVVRNTGARDGGTLLILGSLTAGSTYETEPRYATRTEFDPRFEFVRPPGFPQTDRFEVHAWDGTWVVN